MSETNAVVRDSRVPRSSTSRKPTLSRTVALKAGAATRGKRALKAQWVPVPDWIFDAVKRAEMDPRHSHLTEKVEKLRGQGAATRA